MKLKNVLLIIILPAMLIISACEVSAPYAATSDRPAIPIPESYEAEVASISEILVVETADSDFTDFNPTVIKIWDENGDNIYDNADGRNIALMDDGVLMIPEDTSADGQGLSSAPSLQFERFWKLIEGPEGYPGYTSESHTVTTTETVSSTETYSFTETLSIESTVSVDTLFASASVTASASFSATQEFSNTNWSSDTYSHTFTISALEGKDCIYTVWQLHERLRYVDGEGETYTDTKYGFDESSIVWDYPTEEIVPVTTYF